jgi:hypothetical protein
MLSEISPDQSLVLPYEQKYDGGLEHTPILAHDHVPAGVGHIILNIRRVL